MAKSGAASDITSGQVQIPPSVDPAAKTRFNAALEVFGGAFVFFAATAIGRYAHLTLPSVAFIYFVIMIVAAVRWGFWEATVFSVVAVGCLDYFFTAPLYSFRVISTADLAALAAFEFSGLVASRLSAQAQKQANIATQERNNVVRLYQLSRSILLLDRQEAPGPQLAALIHQALGAESVALYDPVVARADATGEAAAELEALVRDVWIADANREKPETQTWCRMLRLGHKGIGAMALRGGNLNPLVVDAVASIAAVALERARALESETRAEAARRSDQLRTAVLDALAHAFKTPLTAILAASSGLLETALLGPREGELLTIIDDESMHLNDLATRLLQTARLEGAQMPVRREERSVAELIERILAGFPQDFAGHAIEVRTDCEDARVFGNCELIVTALTQLLDNAIKYSDAGTPITISAAAQDGEMIFSVHNRGPAIRPDEREHIFERFYRSPGTEHRAPGTGLGLSITRKVAEAHHGRTWVQSSEAAGTTFFLALPYSAPE